MKKHVLKVWSAFLRDQPERRPCILLNVHGDYEYRNPDSVYIHPFERFKSEEGALDHLVVANHIAPVDRDEWELYVNGAS